MSDRRPAREALDAYLAVLRTAERVEGDAKAECARVLAECPPTTPNKYATMYPDDDPRGDMYRRSEDFPPHGRNMDSPSGPLVWVDRDDPDRKRMVFQLSSVQRWSDWTDTDGISWPVCHALYPNGHGSVWLGVANNSAREDVTGPTEAFALWSAREFATNSPAGVQR